jgi:hypothetical protein
MPSGLPVHRLDTTASDSRLPSPALCMIGRTVRYCILALNPDRKLLSLIRGIPVLRDSSRSVWPFSRNASVRQ